MGPSSSWVAALLRLYEGRMVNPHSDGIAWEIPSRDTVVSVLSVNLMMPSADRGTFPALIDKGGRMKVLVSRCDSCGVQVEEPHRIASLGGEGTKTMAVADLCPDCFGRLEIKDWQVVPKRGRPPRVAA